MANELQIVLADEAIVPGAPVRGVVRVGGSSFAGVVIALEWRTSGPGEPTKQEVARARLPGAELAPGATAELPFVLQIPRDAPVTFAGQLVAVGWELWARVDVGGALGETTRERATVVGGPLSTPFRVVDESAVAPLWRAALSFELAVGLGVGVVAMDATALVTRSIVGVLFAGAVTWLWGTKLREALARRGVGDAEPRCSPAVVRPGDVLVVRLDVPLEAASRIDSIRGSLRGTERVKRGQDDASVKETTTWEAPLAFAREPGLDGVCFVARAIVPPAALPSFVVPGNAVRALLAVEATMKGRLDARWTKDVELHPPLAVVEPAPSPDVVATR